MTGKKLAWRVTPKEWTKGTKLMRMFPLLVFDKIAIADGIWTSPEEKKDLDIKQIEIDYVPKLGGGDTQFTDVQFAETQYIYAAQVDKEIIFYSNNEHLVKNYIVQSVDFKNAHSVRLIKGLYIPEF